MLQLIPKYSIDIKKLKWRRRGIYALPFAMDLWPSKLSDQKDDNVVYVFRQYDIILMPISLLLGYWFIFCLDFMTGTRTPEKLRLGEQHNILTPCEDTLVTLQWRHITAMTPQITTVCVWINLSRKRQSITGLFLRDSQASSGFPSQRTVGPDTASSPWRHHARRYTA